MTEQTRRKVLILLAPLFLPSFLSGCSGSLIKVNVKRIIHASGAAAITGYSITIKNEDETDVNSFKLLLHPTEASGGKDL